MNCNMFQTCRVRSCSMLDAHQLGLVCAAWSEIKWKDLIKNSKINNSSARAALICCHTMADLLSSLLLKLKSSQFSFNYIGKKKKTKKQRGKTSWWIVDPNIQLRSNPITRCILFLSSFAIEQQISTRWHWIWREEKSQQLLIWHKDTLRHAHVALAEPNRVETSWVVVGLSFRAFCKLIILIHQSKAAPN